MEVSINKEQAEMLTKHLEHYISMLERDRGYPAFDAQLVNDLDEIEQALKQACRR